MTCCLLAVCTCNIKGNKTVCRRWSGEKIRSSHLFWQNGCLTRLGVDFGPTFLEKSKLNMTITSSCQLCFTFAIFGTNDCFCFKADSHFCQVKLKLFFPIRVETKSLGWCKTRRDDCKLHLPWKVWLVIWFNVCILIWSTHYIICLIVCFFLHHDKWCIFYLILKVFVQISQTHIGNNCRFQTTVSLCQVSIPRKQRSNNLTDSDCHRHLQGRYTHCPDGSFQMICVKSCCRILLWQIYAPT